MTARTRLGLALILCLPLLLDACATGPSGEHLVQAEFRCAEGRKLKVTFNTTRDLALVQVSKKLRVELPSQHPASGMWYKGSGYELRGAGDTLAFSGEGRPPERCVQAH